MGAARIFPSLMSMILSVFQVICRGIYQASKSNMVSVHVTDINGFIVMILQCCKEVLLSPYLKRGIEAQRDSVTCPWSCSEPVAEMGIKCRFPESQSGGLEDHSHLSCPALSPYCMTP